MDGLPRVLTEEEIRMGRIPRWTYLWPGLARLWSQGSWRALAEAIGFGLILDYLFLATFVWNELLSLPILTGSWLGFCGAWGVALVRQRRISALPAENQDEAVAHLFCAAQSEYLKGHWFETERHLQRLLTLRAD